MDHYLKNLCNARCDKKFNKNVRPSNIDLEHISSSLQGKKSSHRGKLAISSLRKEKNATMRTTIKILIIATATDIEIANTKRRLFH